VESQRSFKRAIVLIVEDEALLRMAAVDFIRQAGFETIEARNADEAIAILETRDDVRIVFTDIDMPGSMDGLKLAMAVRGRWPPIEIIVTSGKYNLRPDQLPTRGEFIGKPYSERDVVAALRRMAA
jgi:two-component system, response regulator PdtaR